MKTFASYLAVLICAVVAIASPSASSSRFDFVASIKVDHTKPPYKHSVIVRLNRRVTKLELRSFAEQQRKNYPAWKYQNLFISYLLVGQPEGSGYWAASHWRPDLEITIAGQSVEQALSTNRRGFVNTGEELVGAWSGIGNENIVVLRRNGRAYFRKQSADGSAYGEHEVTERGRNYFLNSEGTSYSLFEISRDGILIWKLPDGTISYEFAPF